MVSITLWSDFSQVYSGSYNILISNRQADGSLAYVGSSSVDTYGRDFIYEPPPDGCGGGPIEPMYYGDQMERPVEGGRIGYNLSRHVALESEVNFFPRSYRSFVTPLSGGRVRDSRGRPSRVVAGCLILRSPG
jgi:hypothetical protein